MKKLLQSLVYTGVVLLLTAFIMLFMWLNYVALSGAFGLSSRLSFEIVLAASLVIFIASLNHKLN